MSRQVRFRNSDGQQLVGVLDGEEKNGPGVILSHSFTGYKEIPHLHAIAKELADRGITALRFDFSDCVGESDGLCENITLTSQIDDLQSALAFFRQQDGVDPDRIGLGGHSLGGLTSIAVAAEEDIQALVTAGAPAYEELEHLVGGEQAMQEWEETGVHTFNSFKRGEVQVNWSLVEDLRQYDGRELIGQIGAPARLIHGDQDDIVPMHHAEALFRNAQRPRQLHLLKGSDHLYTADGAERELVILAADWFEKQLQHP